MVLHPEASDGPWTGVPARWLSHADMGAQHGVVVELRVPPGGEYAPYRHAEHERVVYVWEGRGTHIGSGGELEVEADDVLVVPPRAWHGFRNTSSEPALLWLAWAPTATFPWDDHEPAGHRTEFDGTVTKRKLRATDPDPDTTPRTKGFDRVGIIWDGAEGAKAITLGWAEFEPRGIHHMHRHANADEAMCITVGRGMHITPDREREMIGTVYDPEFAPAGEWHRFDTSDEHTEGIFFYIGAATLDETGYEVQEQGAPA